MKNKLLKYLLIGLSIVGFSISIILISIGYSLELNLYFSIGYIISGITTIATCISIFAFKIIKEKNDKVD